MLKPQEHRFLPGDIETKHSIEQLPPTPISTEAKEKLESWGLTAEDIKDLQELSSKFRYDLCVQRVERMISEPAELFEYTDIPSFVNFPVYYRDNSDQKTGDCGEIQRNLLKNIHDSGLLEQFNQRLAPPKKIVINLCVGQSRTHFNKPGDIHAWNSLTILDNDDIIDEIYIDASFQEISTPTESGYNLNYDFPDIKEIITDHHRQVKIGTITKKEDGWSATFPAGIVIGMSNISKHIYTIGFSKDSNDKIHPILAILDENSKSDHFTLKPNGELYLTEGLPTEIEQEIHQILTHASNIEFTSTDKPTRDTFHWKKKDKFDDSDYTSF